MQTMWRHQIIRWPSRNMQSRSWAYSRWSVARISQVRYSTLWTMDSNHEWTFVTERNESEEIPWLQIESRELRMFHENYECFTRTTNVSRELRIILQNNSRELRSMHENYELFTKTTNFYSRKLRDLWIAMMCSRELRIVLPCLLLNWSW